MRIRHAAALAALTGVALAVTAALPASAATTESTVSPVEVVDVTAEMWFETGPFVPLVDAGEVEFPVSFVNTTDEFAASAFLVPAGPEGCTRTVFDVAIDLEFSPSLEEREYQLVVTIPPGVYNPGAEVVYEGPGDFSVENPGYGVLALDPLEEAATGTIHYSLAEPLDASSAYLLLGMVDVEGADSITSITSIDFAVTDTCPEPAQLANTGSSAMPPIALAAGAGILALGAALLLSRRRPA